MKSNFWNKPLKLKPMNASWKLKKDITTAVNEKNLKTLRSMNSSPTFSKEAINTKLNSVIAQAGYNGKAISYNAAQSDSVDGYYLPEQKEQDQGKKTLVLDLDETLVHSSFKPILGADIILTIEIENIRSTVYVLVRPGACELLE